jgi:retron-type reverse transcriptase
MKRLNNLTPLIADPDNLRFAFWKARKAKNGKEEVILIRKNLDKNLLLLRNQILTANVEVGNYHYFTIYEPKERLICAASFPQRVLHHAIMNICHHTFEKHQIFDSYASRKEKGTYAAIDRAKAYQKKYRWFLKLDVRKYFDSIDHEILKQMLRHKFKDNKLLIIFYQIIDSYHTQTKKGLPIGNLTSQYLANHYLSISDHYIKEKLQVKAYVRYMDDMVLWSNSKAELLNLGNKFMVFIKNTLKLELKPFCLNATDKGLPFLGYLLNPTTIRLNRNSKKRFIKKLEFFITKLNNNEISQTDFQRHLVPLLAFTKHANTFAFRTKCLQNI